MMMIAMTLMASTMLNKKHAHSADFFACLIRNSIKLVATMMRAFFNTLPNISYINTIISEWRSSHKPFYIDITKIERENKTSIITSQKDI